MHDFGGVLGQPLDTICFLRLLQCHGHDSWLVCEVNLIPVFFTLWLGA